MAPNRLNVENDKTIKRIKELVTANTLSNLVEHSVDTLKSFFMDDGEFDYEANLCYCEPIKTLTKNICEQWSVLRDVPTLDTFEIGCQHSVSLRQMFQKSTRQFRFVLVALLVSTPHNT